MAKRKKTAKWKTHLFSAAALMMAVVYSSMAIVMVVGMIPTVVAGLADRTKGKTKTLTVGAINFAGCAPFMMEVWKKGGSLDVAITYIMQPRTIVVMYFAALMGYMLEWFLTGLVSSVIVQKAKARLKEIESHQAQLVERWGPEVAGNVPLDEYGFPLERHFPEPEEKAN